MRTPLQRWAAKVVLPAEPEGCWRWTGALTHNAYGKGTANHRSYLTHRFAYERFVGAVPPGLTLDHSCRNRACENPEHLQPATNQENTLRGVGFAARFASRNHCNHWHPFDESNTIWRKPPHITGRRYRQCRECRNQASRNHRQRAA